MWVRFHIPFHMVFHIIFIFTFIFTSSLPSLWQTFHMLFHFHTSYTVKYALKKWSPFHMVFTCLFHISVKFCGKNCVKTMWTSCEEFTWFSHSFHIVFTLTDWDESSHCCCHTITRSHLWGFSVMAMFTLLYLPWNPQKFPKTLLCLKRIVSC